MGKATGGVLPEGRPSDEICVLGGGGDSEEMTLLSLLLLGRALLMCVWPHVLRFPRVGVPVLWLLPLIVLLTESFFLSVLH